MINTETLTTEDMYVFDNFIELYKMPESIEKAKLITVFQKLCKEAKVQYAGKIKEAEKTCKKQENSGVVIVDGFDDCSFSEEYTVNNDGVFLDGYQIMRHPILPICKYENIVNGARKVELWWKITGEKPKTAVFDYTVLTSSRDFGMAAGHYLIAINPKNAGDVCKYIQDMIIINGNHLPIKPSIGRMGWINGQCSPFLNGIMYDGDVSYSNVFNAVRQNGDYNLWKSAIQEKCKFDVFRFLFLASVASPLLNKINALPFIVHIDGMTGGGKTLTLQAVVSAWGDPLALVQSHNTTGAGIEVTANFLNSLPLCLDESQQSDKERLTRDIYMLANGKGKRRATAKMTIRDDLTWNLITISTGEVSLTDQNSQAGEINRILAIKSDVELYPNKTGPEYAEIIQKNYGFIAERWIKYIIEHEMEIKQYYRQLVSSFSSSKATDKQMLSVCVILTAREFFNKCFDWNLADFGKPFISSIIKDHDQVEQSERAYEYLVSEIASNPNRFESKSNMEQWGKRNPDNPNQYFIITAKLSEILSKKGFNKDAVLDKWVKNNHVDEVNVNKWINNTSPRCWVIRVESNGSNEDVV